MVSLCSSNPLPPLRRMEFMLLVPTRLTPFPSSRRMEFMLRNQKKEKKELAAYEAFEKSKQAEAAATEQ